MKYAFIKANRDEFDVSVCCEVLSVSRSGYYEWLKWSPGVQACANEDLDAKITKLYHEHHERAGAPRLTQELKANGEVCSQNRVARRMKHLGLRALAKRKFKVTTDSEHNKPLFDNVLQRDFSTHGINQKWCSDITYIHTIEGWLYLAVILDLHSRAIIGWSMDKRMKTHLVCDALKMALHKRHYPKQVIVHSDRGSQYCSNAYRKLLEQYQLIGSMSRKANCWDNAVCESFFHSLKVELVHRNKYASRLQAKQSLFQYIEGYYNRRRLHSAIDYKTPCEFEYAA